MGVWRSREWGLGGVRRSRELGSKGVVMNVGCLPQLERDGDFQQSVPWLMNLFSRGDDLQHIALLLYGRLPTMFGFSKTDTAAVVGEVLQRTIRHWVDDFVSNGGEFSDSQQDRYIRNNTQELCDRVREYVREDCAPQGPHSWNLLSVVKQ